MGQIKNPIPVKLFIGVIFRDDPIRSVLEDRLRKKWGDTDIVSPVFPFDKTDYYAEEMGDNLKKIFYGFHTLVSPDAMAGIKLAANAIEAELSSQSGDKTFRRVNVDPGYISPAKVVLATTKDYSHRIYLGQGIYAEATLHYRGGSFRPFPWTYPDFENDGYRSFFLDMRRILLENLRPENVFPKK